MTHLLPTPLVLDRGGAVARQRSVSKTWLLSTDFSWSALSTSCRFAVEQAVESKQPEPTRPLAAKNVQLMTEGDVL